MDFHLGLVPYGAVRRTGIEQATALLVPYAGFLDTTASNALPGLAPRSTDLTNVSAYWEYAEFL